MQRICFVLQVKPGRLAEYKERHRAVWQDMKAALRENGLRTGTSRNGQTGSERPLAARDD
jgi:L-rhamnose mutarotase